jgi:hypothetical protein
MRGPLVRSSSLSAQAGVGAYEQLVELVLRAGFVAEDRPQEAERNAEDAGVFKR